MGQEFELKGSGAAINSIGIEANQEGNFVSKVERKLKNDNWDINLEGGHNGADIVANNSEVNPIDGPSLLPRAIMSLASSQAVDNRPGGFYQTCKRGAE
ncbi:hypothetical protein V6N13_015066 [Hibiscus sabdariffa]